MRFSSSNRVSRLGAIRAAWTGGILLLGVWSISPVVAGGLDILYPEGRANPRQQFPGLDVFAGRPPSADTRIVLAQPPVSAPGEWPGFDVYQRPPTVVVANTYVPKCRHGIWRFSDGAQVAGVACLQPDGTWRFVR